MIAGDIAKSDSIHPTSLATFDKQMSTKVASLKRNGIIFIITSSDGSTGRGILIGMLSAFGSAAFVVLIFAIFYFFRHTSRGRIFLDRLGRPGEYDDEQALAREEAEALDGMDDLRRVEYLRAKGNSDNDSRHHGVIHLRILIVCSFHTGQSSRDDADRDFAFSVSSHTRKRRFGLGI